MMRVREIRKELTWKEVLDKDPQYCKWVLSRTKPPRPARNPALAGVRRAQPRPAAGPARRSTTTTWCGSSIIPARSPPPQPPNVCCRAFAPETGDAHEGDGVTRVSLQQDTPYAVLHENNYDGAVPKARQEAYASCGARNCQASSCASTNDRDVWVLPTTKPLDLKKTGAELSWRRARHGDTTVYWLLNQLRAHPPPREPAARGNAQPCGCVAVGRACPRDEAGVAAPSTTTNAGSSVAIAGERRRDRRTGAPPTGRRRRARRRSRRRHCAARPPPSSTRSRPRPAAELGAVRPSAHAAARRPKPGGRRARAGDAAAVGHVDGRRRSRRRRRRRLRWKPRSGVKTSGGPVDFPPIVVAQRSRFPAATSAAGVCCSGSPSAGVHSAVMPSKAARILARAALPRRRELHRQRRRVEVEHHHLVGVFRSRHPRRHLVEHRAGTARWSPRTRGCGASQPSYVTWIVAAASTFRSVSGSSGTGEWHTSMSSRCGHRGASTGSK